MDVLAAHHLFNTNDKNFRQPMDKQMQLYTLRILLPEMA